MVCDGHLVACTARAADATDGVLRRSALGIESGRDAEPARTAAPADALGKDAVGIAVPSDDRAEICDIDDAAIPSCRTVAAADGVLRLTDVGRDAQAACEAARAAAPADALGEHADGALARRHDSGTGSNRDFHGIALAAAAA